MCLRAFTGKTSRHLVCTFCRRIVDLIESFFSVFLSFFYVFFFTMTPQFVVYWKTNGCCFFYQQFHCNLLSFFGTFVKASDKRISVREAQWQHTFSPSAYRLYFFFSFPLLFVDYLLLLREYGSSVSVRNIMCLCGVILSQCTKLFCI